MALCDIVLGGPMSLKELVAYRHEFLLLQRVFGRAKMEPLDVYESLAVGSGLVVETKRNISVETRPTFARWRDNADRHRAEVVELLGEQTWREFVEASRVLERLWDEDKLGYGVFVAVKPPPSSVK